MLTDWRHGLFGAWSRISPVILGLMVVAGVLATGRSGSARSSVSEPEPITRAHILKIARSAVGHGYFWGHGSWTNDPGDAGSCFGTCPDCTYWGAVGTDCSGHVAKAWQVPGPSTIYDDLHPFSTWDFRFNNTHWSRIARRDLRPGDALVYRDAGNIKGHIVIFERFGQGNRYWVYEARGCSYGVVHNQRRFGGEYIAIRRNNVIDGPENLAIRDASDTAAPSDLRLAALNECALDADSPRPSFAATSHFQVEAW